MNVKYSVNHRVVGKDESTFDKSVLNWSEVQSSVEELCRAAVVDGVAIHPATFTGSAKVKEQFKGYEILVVDVDNKGDTGKWTLKEALADPFIQGNAFAIWTSSSHLKVSDSNPDGTLEKFRIGFALKPGLRFPPGSSEGIQQYTELLQRTWQLIPGYDKDCKWHNFFAGAPGGQYVIVNPENTLDVDALPPLPEKPKRERREFDPAECKEWTKEQSIGNLERLLDDIDSGDQDNWKAVVGALANIAPEIGEDEVLDRLLAWCPKDYPEWYENPSHERQTTGMFFKWLGTGQGGWSKLRELAGREEYQPEEEVDALDLLDVAPVAVVPRVDGEQQVQPVSSDPNVMPTRAQCLNITAKHEDEPIARRVRLVIEEAMQGKLAFNELTRNIEVCGEVLPTHQFETAEHWVDVHFGIITATNKAQSAIKYVANQRRYHPIRNYLMAVEREAPSVDLDAVMGRVLGISNPLELKMVRCWLVGAVSKVLQEGSDFIEVLCLINPRQGIGKSAFFKTLASPLWYSDSFDKADSEKDRLLILHSAWINEVSELDQFSQNKRDLKQLKSLISATHDDIRVPYGVATEKVARRFVLGATSNDPELFESDDEQRRVWAIEVHPTTECGRLDKQYLEEMRDSIWATAVRLFREQGDEAFKLDKDERAEVIRRNKELFRRVEHYEDQIRQFLENHDIKAISSSEVIEHVLHVTHVTRALQMRVAGILAMAGYKRLKNKKKLGQMFTSLFVNEARSEEFNPSKLYHTPVRFLDNYKDDDETPDF